MEVEPITTENRERFGELKDRVIVFDLQEMLILKRAALRRIHCRREAGLEPLREDKTLCEFSSEVHKIVTDSLGADVYAFLLEEVSESLTGNQGDIPSQNLAASCTQLARNLMISNIEFNETQSFDPNAVNWQSGMAS
jgi:hypothetical protein